MNIVDRIAAELSRSSTNVEAALDMFSSGATVPFVARYRKDQTGAMDEVVLQRIQDLFKDYSAIEERRKTILEKLKSRGLLTADLKDALMSAPTLSELEDVYLPFKIKKATRAEKARKAGLEGLARIIMAQKNDGIQKLAVRFVKGEIKTVDAAIAGAVDIMAEWINEHQYSRKRLRSMFRYESEVRSKVVKGKEKDGDDYVSFFDFREPVKKLKSHRLLALLRGEKEGVLSLSFSPERSICIKLLEQQFVKSEGESADIVKQAVGEAYSRFLRPSLQNELRAELKEKADISAVQVFTSNLRQLLLAPPLGAKNILAIDPGYKSGCKVVCLDRQGALLAHDTIYPHPPQKKYNAASNTLRALINAHKIEVIAIGNGTAGRETEQFIKRMEFKSSMAVFMVNEDGASVYSASAVGREEFPSHDVTVRGAVSIGRRLMDPLAELVKIEPQSLGVGQYQHDIQPALLKDALNRCVESAVNEVGVELNTASPYLLARVSGLGPALARSVIEHRSEKGAFKDRKALLDVKGLGAKAFEQCAGFLRIGGAVNPLDDTAVHPESYNLVGEIARSLGANVTDLIRNDELLGQIDKQFWIDKGIGEFTLNDLIEELKKPGRDPRRSAYFVEFDSKINSPSHLKEGSEMWGVVTNITHFGAFVDIGVKQDGMVHISELADRFVSDPFEVVRINQPVKVKVLSVDIERKRIALSMKQATIKLPPGQA